MQTAINAALQAGKILEKYFETDILKEFKEDQSIVTLADREAEDAIVKMLNETFPEHSIIGEETGAKENGHEFTWYIDPIDGTRNFSNGMPFFAVSIALLQKLDVVLCVIYNPTTNSLFYAEKGKGAYLNERRIYVSKDDISKAIFAGGKGRKPADRQLYRELMHNLPEKFPGLTVRDTGCCALDLAFVARGGFEASINLGLHSYDFAAGVLLIQEAGGKITRLDGSEWNFPDNYFVVSNGIFHDLLVSEIKKIKDKIDLA